MSASSGTPLIAGTKVTEGTRQQFQEHQKQQEYQQQQRRKQRQESNQQQERKQQQERHHNRETSKIRDSSSSRNSQNQPTTACRDTGNIRQVAAAGTHNWKLTCWSDIPIVFSQFDSYQNIGILSDICSHLKKTIVHHLTNRAHYLAFLKAVPRHSSSSYLFISPRRRAYIFRFFL